jgi:hypothetical protein
MYIWEFSVFSRFLCHFQRVRYNPKNPSKTNEKSQFGLRKNQEKLVILMK